MSESIVKIGIGVDSVMRRATCLGRFVSGTKHSVTIEGGENVAGATGLLIILTSDGCHVAAECALTAGAGVIDLATELITSTAMSAGVGAVFSLPFIICSGDFGTIATGNAHIMSSGKFERVESGGIALHKGDPGRDGVSIKGDKGDRGDPADLSTVYDSEGNPYIVTVVNKEDGSEALAIERGTSGMMTKYAHRDENNTFSEINTFERSPVVPDSALTDATGKAANTKFVKEKLDNLLASNNSWQGNQTFLGEVSVPDVTVDTDLAAVNLKRLKAQAALIPISSNLREHLRNIALPTSANVFGDWEDLITWDLVPDCGTSIVVYLYLSATAKVRVKFKWGDSSEEYHIDFGKRGASSEDEAMTLEAGIWIGSLVIPPDSIESAAGENEIKISILTSSTSNLKRVFCKVSQCQLGYNAEA